MARRFAVGAVAVAALIGLGACGSADAGHVGGSHDLPPDATTSTVRSRTTRPPARPTTTTAPAARNAPRAVRPAGAPAWPGGDTTSPPVVSDQGVDYVAIWRSLDGYRIWLEQHHPDPALIPRVWVRGSAIAARFERELGSLAASRVRWYDLDERQHVRVASVVEHEVTLLLDEENDGARIVDDNGRAVDTHRQHRDEHYIVLMDRDGQGHWRIASIATRITDGTEVKL
jgi:hypothetical protein